MDKNNKEKSMTALVCAFARAYHSNINDVKIFDDTMAEKIMFDEEYEAIKKNMSDGIDFFNKDFRGSRDEALRWIVDNQLSPSTLGRSAYAERKLELGARAGMKQYLIFGAGFDTFAYRQPSWSKNMQIFEIDHPLTSEDKLKRLAAKGISIPSNVNYISADLNEKNWLDKLLTNSKFNPKEKSFCSLLGISYYISKDSFKNMLSLLSRIVRKDSIIVLDYPTGSNSHGDKRVNKQEMMAKGANEAMISAYSPEEMSDIMSKGGYDVTETLTPDEITCQFFSRYNMANKTHQIKALAAVNFCAAIKK